MMVLQNSVPQRHAIFGIAVVADQILTTLVLCSVMFKLCNLEDVKMGYTIDELKYFSEKCSGVVRSNECMLTALVVFLTMYIFPIMGMLIHTNKHLYLQMRRMKLLCESMIDGDPLANSSSPSAPARDLPTRSSRVWWPIGPAGSSQCLACW